MPYLGKSPSSGVRTRFVYAATAGQTSFSGNDSAGISLAYDDNLYLDVYQNGVLLKPVTDYAATTGTSVVLTTGATTDDVVEMIVYDTFAVADTVSAKDGGAFAGAVSMASGFTASDGCTITTADNTTQLTLTSTDADAAVGPVMDFNRNSASAADNDLLGRLNFIGKNDAGEDVEYGLIRYKIADASDGSEDGDIAIRRMVAGTSSNMLNFKETETIFNEDSKDIDFRVESLGDANSFVVEGATRGIGMGTADPTIDSSLAGVSLSVASRVLHIHDDNGAYLKLTDPATGSNRGAQFALIGTDAILNNCETGTLIFGTGNVEHMRISSGGNIRMFQTGSDSPGLGNTTTGHAFQPGGIVTFSSAAAYVSVNRNGDGTRIQFNNSGNTRGSITVTGTSTAYNTSSDYRLKENVNYTWDATSRLKQLKPAKFNFIDDDTNTLLDGFLAHEVSGIVPEAIYGEKDAVETWTSDEVDNGDAPDGVSAGDNKLDAGGNTIPVMQQIDQSKLVPLLVKTIQELEARITALEA